MRVFLLFLTFYMDFRNCDAEAFSPAAAQDRSGPTGVCRIPKFAKEKAHRFLYVSFYLSCIYFVVDNALEQYMSSIIVFIICLCTDFEFLYCLIIFSSYGSKGDSR